MVVIFHDRRGDRMILRQPNSLIAAAVIGVFSFAVLVFLLVMALRDGSAGLFWFVLVLCLGMAALFAWLIAKVATDVVATFDGGTRTVTIRRIAPWRTQTETLAFDDVYVEAQERSQLIWYGGINFSSRRYYGIAISLPRERTLWLSPAPETECYDMARQVMTLIRRPRAQPA
jgi:hypothetical protein